MMIFKKLTKNKSLELVLTSDIAKSYFIVECILNKKQSHAGLHFFISIWKFSLEFNVYDNRHWNEEMDCWEER